jgi:hypothetical protein
LRSAAKRIGVSAATLSRAEGGCAIEVDSYLTIARFLGMPAEAFLSFTGNTNCNIQTNQENVVSRALHASEIDSCSMQASPIAILARQRDWHCCSATR